MKYEVYIQEVWTRKHTIESDEPLTDEKAQELANNSQDENEDSFEYSYTIEPDQWPVMKVE